MGTFHKKMAAGKWNMLSLLEQMANIGSEIERSIKWKNKGHAEYANLAFERCLELFDLVAADKKNRRRLKEVLRAREMFADFFTDGQKYENTAEEWQKYFFYFNFAARIKRVLK